MIERSLFREDHDIWRATVRRFVEEEIVPFHAQWEHDGIVPRELWLKAGEMGLLCCTVPEEYGGSRAGLSVRRRRLRGTVARRRERTRVPDPYRSRRHLHSLVRHRGAEAALAAQNGPGRGDRLARHDRTARGQRPQGGAHAGHSRRRRFRRQWPESLHLQRPALRRRRARHQDRFQRRGERDHVVSRRVQSSRFCARPQSRKARHEGAGHLGTVFRERPRARRAICWAAKGRASR